MSNPLQPVIVGAIAVFVVIPMFKALWEFLTREPKPKVILDTEPEFQRETSVQEFTNPDNSVVKWWQAHTPGFVAIESTGDAITFYGPDGMTEKVRAAIIEGRHRADAKVYTNSKGQDGKWSTATQTISTFADSAFRLKVLYRPVWSHAMAGLKWGVLAGIALKLLDTAIGLLSVEPGAGICFLVAVGVCFIPRIGIVGMIVISVVMGQFYRGNFFMMGISAAIIGAVLGCLPGMGLGGLAGLARRTRLPRASDADAEGEFIWIRTALLPLAGGAALFAIYIFVFNPWLVSVLSKE